MTTLTTEKLSDYGVHWFRRDLRVAGNPALAALAREHRGRVVGVFCFDRKFLARPDFSTNRFGFFLETLEALRKELQDAGSDLLVLDVGPEEAFAALLAKLPVAPKAVSWNRDYEPFAVARDVAMKRRFAEWGLVTREARDHLLIEPAEIAKDDGSPYVVFTPFAKKWMKVFATEAVQQRLKGTETVPKLALRWKQLLRETFPDVLAAYRKTTPVTVPLPPAGAVAARRRVSAFRPLLAAYDRARDFPARAGTSRFSVYFKNGSLTTAQVIAAYGLKGGVFLRELLWREFFYHILARFPYVEKEAFQPKYRALVWENDERKFRAWMEGRTGFPIVDAAMRELAATGWMHNRARMIVSSFLTKDLLVDWRWGERYFMERLLDGDLAPNNGGWQWAASTGCDAQPYFRIFNPALQRRKFDPKGSYLRQWVPELERGGYPEPIVDHASQRDRALALYRRGKGALP